MPENAIPRALLNNNDISLHTIMSSMTGIAANIITFEPEVSENVRLSDKMKEIYIKFACNVLSNDISWRSVRSCAKYLYTNDEIQQW